MIKNNGIQIYHSCVRVLNACMFHALCDFFHPYTISVIFRLQKYIIVWIYAWSKYILKLYLTNHDLFHFPSIYLNWSWMQLMGCLYIFLISVEVGRIDPIWHDKSSNYQTCIVRSNIIVQYISYGYTKTKCTKSRRMLFPNINDSYILCIMDIPQNVFKYLWGFWKEHYLDF